jgi:hypothetical protein
MQAASTFGKPWDSGNVFGFELSRTEVRYWINTVSHDHVIAGMAGGFTQADHGRVNALRRLSMGDLIAFYSPRTRMHNGEPLQRFTAVARVLDDAPYRAQMTPTFHPWRRRAAFVPCTEAPVRPLIGELGFIEDKRRWGFPFRRGLFEIGEKDFGLIAQAMKAAVP